MSDLNIKTPEWALPLMKPSRYKGAHGGRGSGKSHFFAELALEKLILDPDYSIVCIREIQKSLKFSAMKLIESKIKSLNLYHYFTITLTEIRRNDGDGIIIFQGMQDHTADSIKSLEGFDVAWVEEAQSLSERSLKLLRPTIRNPDSELWFSWNPDQPTDPVDVLLRGKNPPKDAIVVEVNYPDNPFLPDTLLDEAEEDKVRDPDGFDHTWLGAYNTRSEAIIFSGKTEIYDFEPTPDFGRAYYGADWGFSQDPTVLHRMFIHEGYLYVSDEAWSIGVELDDIPALFDKVPGSKKHIIRADSSRPETISHVSNKGFKVKAASKWEGCVEDGITYLRSFKMIRIHPRCTHLIKEAKNYQYKVCKNTDDVLPDIIDKDNHCWDAIRYGLDPMVRAKKEYNIRSL